MQTNENTTRFPSDEKVEQAVAQMHGESEHPQPDTYDSSNVEIDIERETVMEETEATDENIEAEDDIS